MATKTVKIAIILVILVTMVVLRKKNTSLCLQVNGTTAEASCNDCDNTVEKTKNNCTRIVKLITVLKLYLFI